MTELTWGGKHKDGKKQGPVRIALPFQTIETVNETAQRLPIAVPPPRAFPSLQDQALPTACHPERSEGSAFALLR